MRRLHLTGVMLILISIFVLNSCNNPSESKADVPQVETAEAFNITDITAQSGGIVASDGGALVTARGVCWSTDQNPTVEDDTTNDGRGAGTFISIITGLVPETTYYVRAYAINKAGMDYGSTMAFTTEKPPAIAGEWTLSNMRDSALYIAADSYPDLGISDGDTLGWSTMDWAHFQELGVSADINLKVDRTFTLSGNFPQASDTIGSDPSLITINDTGAWEATDTTITIDGELYEIEGELWMNHPENPTVFSVDYSNDETKSQYVPIMPNTYMSIEMNIVTGTLLEWSK